MLVEPTPSPLDLRWRMLGIPVRVHPSFWLFAALFGWTWFQLFGLAFLGVWILCTFFSILLHELGHAMTARAFGQQSHIVLFMMGGVAVGSFHQVSRGKRIAIILAGPAMNFLILGLVIAFEQLFVRGNENMSRVFRWRDEFFGLGGDRRFMNLPGATLAFLKMMNLFWGALNLLPIYPLDGGQVARETISAIAPRQGLRTSLGLSFLTASLIAIYSVFVMNRPDLPYPSFGGGRMDPLFVTIMFGLLAVSNFQMLMQAEREQRRWERDENPW